MKKLLIPGEINKNNFDFLRFFLAVAVIYSHCFVIFYGGAINTEPIRTLTYYQNYLGEIAVDFFFAISGFLIMKSFENSSGVFEYFVKRILRICPGFFVAFLVSVLIFGAMGTINASHKFGQWKYYLHYLGVKRMVMQFFTLEAPRGDRTFASNPLRNQINESLWTIQYEFTCYLLIPLIGLISIIKRKWLALVFFLVSYLSLLLLTFNFVAITDNVKNWIFLYPSEFPSLFSFFFAGSCIYFFRDSIRRNIGLTLLSIVSILLAFWFGSGINLVLPFAGTYLVFYFAYHPGIKFNNFAKRGDFSYGLYLYGWPVQQLVMYFCAGQIDVHGLFFIALPFAFLFAWLSWHIVEHRFLRMKKLFKKRPLLKDEKIAGV